MAKINVGSSITMPSTSTEVGSNPIFHVKEDRTSEREPVSNFSIKVLGSVHVS